MLILKIIVKFMFYININIWGIDWDFVVLFIVRE